MDIQALLIALKTKYGSSFYKSIPDVEGAPYPCTVVDFNGSGIQVTRIDDNGSSTSVLAYCYIPGDWDATLNGLI